MRDEDESFADVFTHFGETQQELLTITKVRDAHILKIVIPAKAGIQCLSSERRWVLSLRGDGDSLAEAVTLFRKAQ